MEPGWIEFVTQAFEEKYGGWQQPDLLDPCRTGLGGCPVQWTSGYELRRLTVGWSRTPSIGVVQDKDMCTFHFLNLTAGAPDATWTSGDYTSVETSVASFWNALKVNYPPETSLVSYTWRADGPSFKPYGTALSPTLRIASAALPGTGTASTVLPPQCAVSVTEVIPATYVVHGVGVPGDDPGTGTTQTRNRWGRFYLPAPSPTTLTDGRWSSTFSNLVATSAQTFYNECVTAQLIPVVYSPTTGSAWSLQEIHVDDLCDVIRSRRFTTPLTRNVKAITQP
jgi:hypothetical protein